MKKRKADDLGILTQDTAVSILRKVGSSAGDQLDGMERLHVLYAVLDRCGDTGGMVASP